MNYSAHRLLPNAVECVPAFFINRERDRERRSFIEAQLAACGLPAERIRAVDGRDVPSALRHYFLENGELTSKLSAGEIGCYASHLLAAQHILARGLPYALIVEDDATLPASLRRDLREILDALPVDWDIVQLCADPTHAFKPITGLRQGRDIIRYSRIPGGAVGYLMSAQGARKFLARYTREWPVDTDIRQPWVFGTNVFGVMPKLIGHSGVLKSAVLEYGERSRRRRGVHRPTLRYPVGSPFHTLASAAFNIMQLGPIAWTRCLAANVSRRLSRWMFGAVPIVTPRETSQQPL